MTILRILGTNALLLSWTLKLTESWGESKTDFLRFSEVFDFCIQEGGGQKVKTHNIKQKTLFIPEF